MFKIKLALLAVISVAGIGAAFASTHKARFAKTYFGLQQTATKVKWVTVLPGGATCSEITNFACQITSAVATATVKALTNAFPATFAIKAGNGRAYIQ